MSDGVGLMYAMEVLSPLRGQHCWRSKELTTEQVKWIRERSHMSSIWQRFFEPVSLSVVCKLATHCNCTTRILRVLCGYFEHQRRVQVRGCVAEPLKTMRAIVIGSKWSCLLLRIALQNSRSAVVKVFHPMKLQAFVVEVPATLDGRNKETPEVTEKVPNTLRMEVGSKGLKPSITAGCKDEKIKVVTSCKDFGRKTSGMQARKGGCLADSVETSGVDLRTDQLHAMAIVLGWTSQMDR